MKKIKLFIQLCNKNQNSLLIFIAILSIITGFLDSIFLFFKFSDLRLLTLSVVRLLTGLAALVYIIRALFNVISLDLNNLRNK